MLVNTFEDMKICDEMEKIVDSVVETGEVTLYLSAGKPKFKKKFAEQSNTSKNK